MFCLEKFVLSDNLTLRALYVNLNIIRTSDREVQ